MKVIDYKIHAPTVLDFLKVYLLDVLGIEIQSRTETKKKEANALAENSQSNTFNSPKSKNVEMTDENGEEPAEESHPKTPVKKDTQTIQKYLIEKMAIYLAKMSLHDSELSARAPSLLAVGAIYVALKICEQLKKKKFINAQVVTRLIQISKMSED